MSVVEWKVVEQPDGTTAVKPFRGAREVLWAPLPGSQEAFLNCPVFEVLLAGNRGGGKTECLLMDFAQHCGQGYGAAWKGVLFRQTYKALNDVVDKSRNLLPRVFPGIRFNQQKNTWVWPSGEQLLLRHIKRLSDYDNLYHGQAYPWQGWEELTTWVDDSLYRRMFSCCRTATPGMPLKIRSTTNPYGPGFSWVRDRFQLPLPDGERVGPLIRHEDEGDRLVIISDLRENKVLMHADPQYVQRLKTAARNKHELDAWITGSWDIQSGGMFDDIWINVREHAVLPEFEIPSSWKIDRSFDWGSSRPFAVGWWAESDGSDVEFMDGSWMRTVRGDLFRIGEWYGWTGEPNRGLRLTATQIAHGIVKREIEMGLHGRVSGGIADASIFDRENGVCIADSMSSPVLLDGHTYPGVYFQPADKSPGSRKQGWQQIRERLQALQPLAEGQPRRDPGLFVVETCKQWLRTVPTLPRSERDMDDVDSDVEDHIGDETRYRVRAKVRPTRFGRVYGLQ